MSFPFMQKRTAQAKPVDPEGRPLIGFTLDGDEPIWGLPGSTLTYAPSGAGKSTCVAMPKLMSFIASQQPDQGILVSDPKDGEIAAQAIPMLIKMGRKFALIDDLHCRPELAEHRISLNAFGAAVSAFRRDPRGLIYANEMNAEALIEEPKDQPDMRNFYFRESPRVLIRFGCSAMLKRDTALCTPGGVAALISDPDMLLSIAEIELEEGNPALQAEARRVHLLKDQEHFAMHMGEAARALRHFGPGTYLAEAGREASLSHEDLIREGYVVFLCGPQALMEFLGPIYALHMGAFTQALYQKIGSLRIIADEFTNSPLTGLIGGAITTVRSYGGTFHLIAQSRSEVLRKYGEHLTQTIEDNCICKRWLAFGNFKEAEEASRAIGEENAISTAISGESGSLKSNTNLSLIKQRQISASELLAMPKDHQLVHIRGIGYFICRTVAQNQIEPYASMLAPNPMEGGRLTPDPKITLVTPEASS